MPTPEDDTFALFVDMLGFASATESAAPFDDREFDYALGTKAGTGEHFDPRHPTSLPLRFAIFHRIVDARVADCPLDSVLLSFSDCAFVICRHRDALMSMASAMMRELICNRIPTRMGIGRGDFHQLRFRADTARQHSSYAAHFVGKSIVRAHAAEQSGVGGMRILLHSSAMDASLAGPGVLPVLDAPSGCSVDMEVNYLTRGRRLDVQAALAHMLQEAPTAATRHYTATAVAHERMLQLLSVDG